MGQFLILLAQAYEPFRVAELEALANLFKLELDLKNYSSDSPFLKLELPSVDDAKRLVERSILCRSVYELYGQGNNLELLHENIRENNKSEGNSSSDIWKDRFKTDSFKFEIITYQGSRSKEERIEIIDSFQYMGLEGPVRMKSPDHTFTILEDYQLIDLKPASEPNQIYFGRFITDSSRQIIEKYDLKKRKYIGTTSFDAELSLITCNIAQITPGKIMYDPFAGTGSFLVAAGYFGGLCLGSDIDVRMIKGKNKTTNIDANFAQYGISNRFLDVMTIDFTNNSFRKNFKFDAIICDPPYGVREGLKVLGSKNPERFKDKENVVIDGILAHRRRDYIAPKKPYEFNSLLDALLEFCSNHLVVNGRLCFWMPTANADFEENHIPHHEDLELLSNCVQEFNKWSRRLVTYRRRPYHEKGATISVKGKATEEFREKYFRGFMP